MKLDPGPYILAVVMTGALITLIVQVSDQRAEIDAMRAEVATLRKAEAIRSARSYCGQGSLAVAHVGGKIEVACR